MSRIIPSVGCLIAALGLIAGLASPAAAAYRSCGTDGSCETRFNLGLTVNRSRPVSGKVSATHQLDVRQTSVAGTQGSVGPMGFDPGQSELNYGSAPNNPYFDWRVTDTLEFSAATGLAVSGDGWESVASQPDLSGLGALPFGGELKARWKNSNTIGVLWHFHRPGQQASSRPRSQKIDLGAAAYKRTTAGPSLVTPAAANPAENVFRSLIARQEVQVSFDDGTGFSRVSEDRYFD